MFKKIVIALIVVGSLVIGYASLAQASHNCGYGSTLLVDNPELAAACRYHNLVTGSESAIAGIIEASGAKDRDLAGYFAVVGATGKETEVLGTGEGAGAEVTDLTDSTALAANPELKLAHRFSPPVNEIDPDRDVGLLEFFTGSNQPASQPVIIDPESLRQFHTRPPVIWVIMPDGSDPGPRLQPIDRESEMTEADFLAANPELKSVRSYPRAVEDEGSQPVTIDLEALREYYANEWTIEADTIDPRPLTQPVDNGVGMTESELLAANPELMMVGRYRIGPLEDVSSHPDPYERTANELARQQNYGASPVGQPDPANGSLPGADLIDNPELFVTQCVAIMEHWNRLHHPGR